MNYKLQPMRPILIEKIGKPTSQKIISMRKPGLIHRKDWEWALGIIAMKRFYKLNDKCTAIGIGSGREEILFYLANNLKHVYATDIYDGKEWDNLAHHQIFLKIQKNMHHFHTRKMR